VLAVMNSAVNSFLSPRIKLSSPTGDRQSVGGAINFAACIALNRRSASS